MQHLCVETVKNEVFSKFVIPREDRSMWCIRNLDFYIIMKGKLVTLYIPVLTLCKTWFNNVYLLLEYGYPCKQRVSFPNSINQLIFVMLKCCLQTQSLNIIFKCWTAGWNQYMSGKSRDRPIRSKLSVIFVVPEQILCWYPNSALLYVHFHGILGITT